MKKYVKPSVLEHQTVMFETSISKTDVCHCQACKDRGAHCGNTVWGCIFDWHSYPVNAERPSVGGNNGYYESKGNSNARAAVGAVEHP